jgi:flavin-dependent dehydrogenase
MNTPHTPPPDVAVIGGGPAGLTAATALANDRSLKVLVLERESAAGASRDTVITTATASAT